MKKTILILLCLISAFNATSQRDFNEREKIDNVAKSKVPTDTLWPGNSQAASGYTLLADSNGGFVLGTNSHHNICIAQYFPVQLFNYRIEGALYWIGTKTASSSDSVNFVVWKMDGAGLSTTGIQAAPGTVSKSKKYSIQDIDTSSSLGNAFSVYFDTIIYIDHFQDFAIGIDLSELEASDTIGLYSTCNGDGLDAEYVWECRGNDSSWHTLQESGWGFPNLLDVDAMILPIIDTGVPGKNENIVMRDFDLLVFPNPARDFIQADIMIKNGTHNGSITLLDRAGKMILTAEKTTFTEGSNHEKMEVSSLTAGEYLLCVKIGGSGVVVPVTIIR